MSASNVIRFDGLPNGQQWIAYKYFADSIGIGTRLIVNPSQEAIFIKGGVICDVFEAGTHILDEENLSRISGVSAFDPGERADSSADIFFVNKAARLDMTWGTANPFQLEDPKYGLIVSIRSHGKYGIRITNSSLFVGSLVGSAHADAVFSHSFVNAYFNSMLISYIKATISSFMLEQKISFLDVTSHLTELSFVCNDAVAREFERYGIEITNLCIETISPPPADFESLKKMKEKRVLEERYDETSIPAIVKKDPGVNICPNCKHEVPAGQKFCGECGTRMQRICSECGSVWDAGHKFCGECGTKL